MLYVRVSPWPNHAPRRATGPPVRKTKTTDSEKSQGTPSESGRKFSRGDEVIHRWLRREIRFAFLANDE